ncbi:MAG: hypothetical protein ACJ72N_07055 [Labedaea sp.]
MSKCARPEDYDPAPARTDGPQLPAPGRIRAAQALMLMLLAALLAWVSLVALHRYLVAGCVMLAAGAVWVPVLLWRRHGDPVLAERAPVGVRDGR